MAQAIQRPRRSGVPAGAGATGHEPHPTHFRGRQHVAAIVVVVVLALVAFRAFPSKDVVVLKDGTELHVRATFDARVEALAAAEVDVAPSDRVLVAETGDQASVVVRRAQPVTVTADGTSVRFHTQAVTIAGALAGAGIDIRPGDQVYVDDTLVTERAPLEAVTSIVSALHARETAFDAAVAAARSGPAITVVRAAPITVVLDTTEVPHNSTAATVDGALRELGILVREGDLVEPGFDATVTPGMKIRIAKARNVTVLLDGKEHTMITQASTVADVLRILEIVPGPEDVISPEPATPLDRASTVTIALTRVVEEEQREPIPPGVTYVTDPSLPQGENRIEQGAEGVRVSRYSITYRNGVESAREMVSSSVVTEPRPTRFITGSRQVPGASAPPAPTSAQAPDNTGYDRKMTVLATWYNASHGGKAADDPWYGYTATGVFLRKGICATDPNVIPMGTWMYIPGYGECLAADIGGGVKGNHVDLGFPEDAGEHPWGTQTLDIYILD